MGLTPSFLRLIIDLHKKVGFESPVLTLGNQDIYGSYEDLKNFFVEASYQYHEPEALLPHTSTYLRENMPERSQKFVHAKVFFEMLGIKEYYDMDKFDIDQPILKHDMNFPVTADLQGKFGWVIDSGTMEHVFDVKQYLTNMVNLTKQDGWVLHISPTSNQIDHGFYSFSPCLFFDFYKANGFDNFIAYILHVNFNNFFEPCRILEYSYGMYLGDLIDESKQIFVAFAAKKSKTLPQLNMPTQGVYDENRGNQTLSNSNTVKFNSLFETFIPSQLQSYVAPLRPTIGHIRKLVLPRYRNLKKI
jgi:hypothetical protein